MAKMVLRLTDYVTEEAATKIQNALGSDWTVTYISDKHSWDLIHVSTQIGFRMEGYSSSNLHPDYIYPIQNGVVNTSKYMDISSSDSSTISILFITTNNGLLVTIVNNGYLAEIAINTNTASCVFKGTVSPSSNEQYSIQCYKFTNDVLDYDTQYSKTSSLLGWRSTDMVVTQFMINTHETGIYFVNSGFSMLGSISDGTTSIFVGQCLGIKE